MRADFALAARLGVTTFPGTSTPITADLKDAVLHNGGVVFATRTTLGATLRYSLLQHRNGTLSVLLNDSGGFPGGGDIQNLSLASDGTAVFVTANRASGNTTSSSSALLRYDAGVATTIIANSATLIGSGPATTGLSNPTAGGGRAAFLGLAATFPQYVYRVQGATPALVAQENVTNQPGASGKFTTFFTPLISPDGTRVFFQGTNGLASTNPDYREGLYVEQAGTLARVFDNTTDVPGAAVKFRLSATASSTPLVVFSPDGAHAIVASGSATSGAASGTARFGLYRFASGALSLVADNTTVVNSQTLSSVANAGAVVANDGTVYFFATGGTQTHLYRARNGTVDLFLRGDAPEYNSFTRLWLNGTNLYLSAFNDKFERVLLRVPITTGTPATAINFATHPAFSAINARILDKLAFAGGQVLVQISTLTNGTLTAAVLYAPAADVSGEAAGGGTAGGSGNPGGGNAGRLANMSIRTTAGTDSDTLIVGVGVGGAGTSGSKAVLLRAVGPTLGSFGVPGVLADPVMSVFQGQTTVSSNDDWAGGFDFASVGAFALAGTPVRDAAIYNPAVQPNSYSIQIGGKNNTTGIALAEVYDATPDAAFTATTPRLVNVSARTQVGIGDNILIAGFAIGGRSPVRVLIRAVGPTLSAFGVGGALSDPKLEVYSGTSKINENDNWSGTAELKAAFASVAAFALANDTSRDAALVATLPPGTYTAQISGVGATTGVALVEVYELP